MSIENLMPIDENFKPSSEGLNNLVGSVKDLSVPLLKKHPLIAATALLGSGLLGYEAGKLIERLIYGTPEEQQLLDQGMQYAQQNTYY